MAGTAWGSIGVLARWLMNLGLGPLEVAWLRGAVSLLGLTPLVLVSEKGLPRLKAADLKLFAAFGLVNVALYNIFYFTAVDLIGVTTAVILLYTAPAFATIFARLTFGEQLTRRKVFAVGLTLLGCFLVVKGYDFAALRLNLPGVLAGLGSGVTYALYGIFGKKARQNYSPWVTVFFSTVFGTLILTLIHPPWAVMPATRGFSFWSSVLMLGLWGSLVPWLAYTIGVGYVEVSRAAVVASVEPVVSVALAAAFLGERFDLLQGAGMVMVLAAVFFTQGEKRSPQYGFILRDR